VVPQNLYTPLKQEAVLLPLGKNNAAALALMKYMRTDRAQAIIRAYGYTLYSSGYAFIFRRLSRHFVDAAIG